MKILWENLLTVVVLIGCLFFVGYGLIALIYLAWDLIR